jgi:hypothetical protein
MSSIEQLLANIGEQAEVRRRPIDVGAALRHLAEDAGYVPPPSRVWETNGKVPPVSRARHQLSAVVCSVLDQPGAAGHVEELASAIGEDGPDETCGPLEDLDIDGAQVFACMLYQADHPESAQFWWQLAAGAGHRMAAYCLHLHHLARGENAEADHWLRQLLSSLGAEDAMVEFMGRFFLRRHRPAVPAREPALTAEVERLATREDTDCVLVCRPEREIADRLQH